MPPPRDGLGTIRGLRARCQEFRSILEDSPELCTPEEVAAYWPGGVRNPHGRTRAGWTYCYGQLAGFIRRLEPSAEQEARLRIETEQARLAALDGSPEWVTLAQRGDEGKRVQKGIFPKSKHALDIIEFRNSLLLRLRGTYHEVNQLGGAFYAEHGGVLLDRIHYHEGLIVWILCHPEPDIPYDESIDEPELPGWIAALAPQDFVQIMRAHQFVNGARMQLAMRLLEADGPGPGATNGLSWGTILSSASNEIGVPVRSLARDHTLESIVTQMATARDAERRARRDVPPPARSGMMPEAVG